MPVTFAFRVTVSAVPTILVRNIFTTICHSDQRSQIKFVSLS